LGIASDVPAEELARAINARRRLADDALAGLLRQVENALHDPELTEDRALDLAQQLSRYTQSLKLIPLNRQETIAHADSVTGAHARTN
jgi:hypothetical protein